MTDKSDLTSFMSTYTNGWPDPQWWRAVFNLDGYYKFRSVLEAVHHYDVDQGKNYYYYLNPQSNKWSILPWDLDLTWSETMFGAGNEPFRDRVLANPAFQLEYQNELRSLRDLLFNHRADVPPDRRNGGHHQHARRRRVDGGRRPRHVGLQPDPGLVVCERRPRRQRQVLRIVAQPAPLPAWCS